MAGFDLALLNCVHQCPDNAGVEVTVVVREESCPRCIPVPSWRRYGQWV
jgi:hypothetical protein